MSIVWNEENAAHLFRRAGFGATPQTVSAAVKQGQVKTVDKILKVGKTNDKISPKVVELDQLQAWWVDLMLKTRYPLTEKLTLFWHNHFATGFSKVGRVDYMHRQNATMRALGTGKFRDLVTAIAKDPAMLIWLDNKLNTKGKPNLNFARELMELFTTGVLDKNAVPNYTEADVAAAAKAFTGWQIKDDQFYFNDSKHDHSVKTFKNLTGDLDGTDVIEHLVLDPATARRIAQQLFSYFAYPVELDHPALDPLEYAYLQNDTAILPVLRTLFLSDDFYSIPSKATAIKEPALFLVIALRAVKAKIRHKVFDKGQKKVVNNTAALSDRLDRLGQSLFDPPTVFGWKYGLAWVSAAGMLERAKAGQWIGGARDKTHVLNIRPEAVLGPAFKKLTAAEVAARILANLGVLQPAQSTLDALTTYLLAQDNGLPGKFEMSSETIDKKIRGAIALVLSTPEYQRA